MKKQILSILIACLLITSGAFCVGQKQIDNKKTQIRYLKTFLDAMPPNSMDPKSQSKVEKEIVDQTVDYIITYVEELRELSPDDAREFDDLIAKIRVYKGQPPKEKTVRKIRSKKRKKPKQKIIVPPKIDWNARYIATKKDENLYRKIVLLKVIAQTAPEKFWMKRFSLIGRQNINNFQKYICRLSRKVAKQNKEIKNEYFKLLEAASKNQYLKKYKNNFDIAEKRANKKK